MTTANALKRVEILEQRVGALEELPARVDGLTAQIVQLRAEMRDEFSAVRAEMQDTTVSLRAEMQDMNASLRAEMQDMNVSLRAEIKAGDDETRALIVKSNQETRTHMLVLHEQLVERIKWMQEGDPSSAPTARKRKRTGARSSPKRRK